MLTTVQSLVNELGTYQVSPEQRSSLAGKGPRMKALAGEIKVLFPTLSTEDKGLFLAAIARGRFEIEKGTIWPMFLDAVGIEAPAPKPAAVSPAPAPATNKVAGEILEHCQYTKVALNLLNKTIEAMLLTMERQADQITALTEKVEAMKRPATRRTTSV